MTSRNILLGGNYGFGSRWVSDRCVSSICQNFSESGRSLKRPGGADVVVHSSPGGGSHSFAAAAAHFVRSTDLCGFQRVGLGAVAWLASHGTTKGKDFCGFAVRCRLTVSYQSRPPIAGMGAPVASDPARAGQGGRPPFVTSRARYARRGCAGPRFEKSAKSATLILASHQQDRFAAELQFHNMGSGDRAAGSRQKKSGKLRVSGLIAVDADRVGEKLAGHLPSDVAVAAMLCGAVNRVN